MPVGENVGEGTNVSTVCRLFGLGAVFMHLKSMDGLGVATCCSD